jgi:ketosteroid isomerase-like protein
MSDENKAVVQHFYDALWNGGNPDAIDDLMDAKCDGEICYPRPGGSLPSAEEAFSAANSALYADSVLTRLGDMTKTHPELAKSIMKGLLIRHEGNFRGIIKSSAKKFRGVVPDVRCTIEEIIAQEDMVWARWTLRGTFQAHGSGAGASLDGKPVSVVGASILRLSGGKIQDYRSYAISDRWLESVAGIVPRP